LLNPWAGQAGILPALACLTLSLLVAVLLGTVEALIARLKLRTVPQYIVVAISAGLLALLATTWQTGGVQ
jgi:formate hydrogenlyase subunit 4